MAQRLSEGQLTGRGDGRSDGGLYYACEVLAGDSPQLRKQRGAFFTPYAIAEHLADWALRGVENEGRVLDPTCGEGVFLLAAAERLAARDRSKALTPHLYGVDVHSRSLDEARRLVEEVEGAPSATFLAGDFFDEPTPDQLGARLPLLDAVIGNPPFVRYHEHRGEVRRRAVAAALAQGVRLSGLSSSWAALLVHASAFLKPEGRIAMVLPAELLSVGYAEPIRLWLRQRFRSVHLVMFDRLQFADAEEQVVLLVARGTGGCNAFTLHHVTSADELQDLHIYDADAFAPQATGKWTDLLISEDARGSLRRVVEAHFQPLNSFGTLELGTVTGANKFFTLSEATRQSYGLTEKYHVDRCVPPGSRHLRGLAFTDGQWEQLRLQGERVWMLNPTVSRPSGGLARYLALGQSWQVDHAYKCTVRTPWWKPPVVRAPDYFFTYMSHISPRLVRNHARATLVNSMHGLTLNADAPAEFREALPTLAVNTITQLGAEMQGRSYGGGILKMEPSEASLLPLPRPTDAAATWALLEPRHAQVEELIRAGQWDQATSVVDDALLVAVLGLGSGELQTLRRALNRIRSRRQRRAPNGV
jgi:adenine-specific DNA-methyltransferase